MSQRRSNIVLRLIELFFLARKNIYEFIKHKINVSHSPETTGRNYEVLDFPSYIRASLNSRYSVQGRNDFWQVTEIFLVVGTLLRDEVT